MAYYPRANPLKGTLMKAPFILLALALSVNTFAQINTQAPCQEFDQRLAQTDRQVNDFDKEMRKLDNKLRNVEDRLAERTRALDILVSQRRDAENDIRSLGAEEMRIRQEGGSLQVQATRLSVELNQKSDLKRSFEQRAAATSNLNQKREFLREAKRLEKEIEALAPALASANQQIAANNARLNQIGLQTQQASQQIAILDRQIDQERRDPAIQRLQQERQMVQNELSNAQISLDGLKDQQAKARFHVEMCHGYLELSVKYPAALKIAKKVQKQGCDRYVPRPQGSELENQAQDDVLDVVCKQRD